MKDEPKSALHRVFVLGGVRSGKSRYAAEHARSLAAGKPVLFVATADSRDADTGMKQRITRHQSERPAEWETVEEPVNLPGVLAEILAHPGPEPVVIVDCLTVWISNLLARCGDSDSPGFYAMAEGEVMPALDDLATAVEGARRHVVLIANDVGTGVAPPTRLGNVFADLQGIVNQRVAAVCDEVHLMVAGIEIRIK